VVIIQPSASRTTSPLAPFPSSKLLGYFHSSALRTDKSTFRAKPLQPILTFGSFLLNDSNLVNEVISGFGPICFAIIRTNGCPSFYQLISDYIASFPNR